MAIGVWRSNWYDRKHIKKHLGLARMSPRINRDHFAALIAVEISELKRLSNGSKHSRAPVTLD